MNYAHHLRILYMGALIEEEENKKRKSKFRYRYLRDHGNPFEIPNKFFKQMFRLNKRNVINLINDIKPLMQKSKNNIPLHLKLLATLHFIATGSLQNSVGCNNLIGLSQPSISRAINEICTVISDKLFHIWVKFPTSDQEKNQIKDGFYEKCGLKDVLGVIDGSHIEITSPPVTDEDHPPFVYINNKGKLSINVMLISDANSKIIGCNAKFPGSISDNIVWQYSNIRKYLEKEHKNGDNLSHLIGDCNYFLEPWLFTPIPYAQPNTSESKYNEQIKSGLNIIERTNGMLKGRFKCLSRHRILIYHPVKAAKIINTCCVLHNMAIEAGLPIQECKIEYRENEIDDTDLNMSNNNNMLHLQGVLARDEYIKNNIEA